jgi:hypothetical protein
MNWLIIIVLRGVLMWTLLPRDTGQKQTRLLAVKAGGAWRAAAGNRSAGTVQPGA